MSCESVSWVCASLMACIIVDFEQPRALWTKVFDDKAKDAYVKNVSGHLGTVKSNEIKARQRACSSPCLS